MLHALSDRTLRFHALSDHTIGAARAHPRLIRNEFQLRFQVTIENPDPGVTLLDWLREEHATLGSHVVLPLLSLLVLLPPVLLPTPLLPPYSLLSACWVG